MRRKFRKAKSKYLTKTNQNATVRALLKNTNNRSSFKKSKWTENTMREWRDQRFIKPYKKCHTPSISQNMSTSGGLDKNKK